jgi:ureidoacrylate peracid hydrolase
MHKIAMNAHALARGRQNRGGLEQSYTSLMMSKVAHIVVDMQNGFLKPGAVSEVPYAREIVDNINSISRAVRRAGGYNVFLRMTYDPSETVPWTSWYGAFLGQPFAGDTARAFTKGTEAHDLWPGIDRAPGESVLNKTRFGGFTPNACELDALLKERGVDTVIVTGTLTNCCSEATARGAQELNYKVIFIADANATFTDDEQNGTLSTLYPVYSDVIDTNKMLTLIEPQVQRSASGTALSTFIEHSTA